MIETFNRAVMAQAAAPPDLSGGALLVLLMLAEWAFLAGPATLVLLWVLGGREDRRAAVGAGMTALLALATAAIISALYFHPRPFMVGLAHNYLRHVPDSSFPSDHATLLFALGFALSIKPPTLMRRSGHVLLALACAVGWARVYLGAHFPFDIVGGALLGLFFAAILATWPVCVLRDGLVRIGEKLYALPLQSFGLRRR